MKENQKNRELVFRFLRGNLTEAEESELLEKIRTGEYSRVQFLEDQRELRQEAVISANTSAGKSWERLKTRIEAGQEQTQPVVRKMVWRRDFISIAAAFAIGVLLTSVIYFLQSDRSSHEAPLQEVFVPHGARTNITLPDGSTVCLNSGSRLVYPLSYSKERTVELEGEAYFEVVKSKTPFRVSTSYGEVEVLGTSFNVKAFTSEEFQTTLVEGTVRLSGFAVDPVLLKPGEQALFRENSNLSVEEVNTELYTSWKDGKLIFYREPFEKVAARLERWYNVKIKIEDEDFKKLWFTGTVEMETFTEFMELIGKSYPIQCAYNQQTRTMIIEKK